jgi:hypothetical protein
MILEANIEALHKSHESELDDLFRNLKAKDLELRRLKSVKVEHQAIQTEDLVFNPRDLKSSSSSKAGAAEAEPDIEDDPSSS